MAKTEVRIDHDRLRDPETITKVVQSAFKEKGLDIHRHEADHHDEFSRGGDKGTRVYKIKNVKFFGPWSHRG